MSKITEILESLYYFINTFFHMKDWRGIGFDKSNGVFVINPDRRIMKIYAHTSNEKGYFSMTQANNGNPEEVFFQFHFKDIKEIELITDCLFKLRMDMVLESIKKQLPNPVYGDHIDDLVYEPSDSIFLEHDEKYKVAVCAYKTENGEIAQFMTIAALARFIKMPPAKVDKLLKSGILCEVTKGYQIRYAFDKHTFIPKDKIKMLNHTYNADEIAYVIKSYNENIQSEKEVKKPSKKESEKEKLKELIDIRECNVSILNRVE